MPRPPSLCMNDIVREDQNKKQQHFLHDSEDFPCLFKIGNCKLDIGSRKYNGIAVCELDVSENKWKSLQKDLNNDSEVSECDKEVWKDNLLTYVYAELGNLDDAFKLNKKIQDQHRESNLIALVNAAFLFYKTDNLLEACRTLDDLKMLKSQQTFADLKIDAICELGYAFRKLAGAKNLQFSISFLEFALLVRPHEQIQLMLAIVYRRCCNFNIYSADPEKINRHDFAIKAANSLFEIGTKSTDTSFKAAALIELAYLKYEDDVYVQYKNNGKQYILSPQEWFQIVQGRTWKQLCEEAIEACEDGPSEKVLKIAGQLYRYYGKDDEFLEKSEQLLIRAIEKKPSTRAHHHLGLTYKTMATFHEQKDDMNQNYSQGPPGGYNVRTGRQYMLNRFANNTGEMKCTNRGYCHQRVNGRQEHNIHRQNHVEVVGDQNARSSYHTKPKTLVTNMEMRHTNSGHLCQGFTSQSVHNKHEIVENKTEGADGCTLQVLPKPPVNNMPQKPENYLKFKVRVPDQFKSFSKDNPHTEKAIYHLLQAVDISCCQNRLALYDLACILVRTDKYEKSKEICKNLIKECTSSKKKLTFDPVYLVNAYNLYGICYAKEAEAEVNQVNKKRLDTESVGYLTLAVRLASYLAATVPELETCATDLWKGFRTLQKKFKFEGQKESRDKLYSLCEYISDYRYLEAVDEIFSQDPEELKKVEVIEQCLQRYLYMKAYDSALLFRDLIILQPEVKAKLLESKVYKQLMLEVAEGKLEKMYLEGNTEACHPDPAWKQLFNDKFTATGNPKKYDIVIVSDVEDYELKRGMMCDIAQHLQQILLEIFGLSVVHAHEESFTGRMYLNDQLQIIQNSQVSMFVLTDPCIDSLSLRSKVAGLRISEGELSVPESASVNEESNDSCTHEAAPTSNRCANQNSLSPYYERIIDASLCNSLNKIGAARMILVIPDSLKPEDLPQSVRGLPNITLSPSEIEILTATAQGSINEQCINLMKKIFRAVLGNLLE